LNCKELRMATCPKCNKRELRPEEDLCPHCANKKTKLWVRIGEGVLAVAAVVVPIAISVITKKPPKA
jgi:uncharacterized OB-fold protein